MAKKYSVRPHRKRHPLMKALGVVLGLALLGSAGIFFAANASFETDLFRGEMISLVGRKTGLEPYWETPVAVSFSWDRGLSLSIRDAELRNPAWASRKAMAKIGRIDFALDPLSLLQGRIDIERFDLVNADILIETSPSGETNLNVKQKDEALPGDAVLQTYRYFAGRIQAVKLGVVNSSLVVRTPQGELFSTHVDSLRLVARENKTRLTFEGLFEGIPLRFDARSEGLEKLSGADWPFALDARFGGVRFRGTGKAYDKFKLVEMRNLAIEAGASKLAADLNLVFTGERPLLAGRVTGSAVDLADFKGADDKPMPYYFGRKPLPFTLLRRLDAKIDFGVADVAYGPSNLQNVGGRIENTGGVLSVAPFQFTLAGSTAALRLKLDARGEEAGLALLFQARKMDISRLFSLGGIESILTGRADIDANLRAIGRSPHSFAAHTDGYINLVAAGGTVSGQAISKLGREALAAIAPGLKAFSNPQMDCFAGKFYIKDGRAVTKGLLIDGENVAILGRGGFDLGEEKIDIAFKPYARGTDLSTLFPPMRVHGTFLERRIDFDADEAFEKALSLFTIGEVTDTVPTELSTTEGARACALAKMETAKAPPSEAGQAVEGFLQKFKLRLKGFSDRMMPSFQKNMFNP